MFFEMFFYDFYLVFIDIYLSESVSHEYLCPVRALHFRKCHMFSYICFFSLCYDSQSWIKLTKQNNVQLVFHATFALVCFNTRLS